MGFDKSERAPGPIYLIIINTSNVSLWEVISLYNLPFVLFIDLLGLHFETSRNKLQELQVLIC